MRKILIHLKKIDWLMVISALLLSAFGLLSIYSSSFYRADFSCFKKQALFLGLGLFLMILFSFFDWRIFQENSYLILILYFLSCLSLLGLFFFAPSVRGTHSWYKWKDFALHPVEFVKPVLIILLAKHFSLRHIEIYRLRHIFSSGLYFLVPAFLLFLQPDMGQVIIVVLIWLGVLVVSGIRLKQFLALVLIFLLVSLAGWFTVLKPYQKERIISFVAPYYDPLGSSWSQNQSKIAIGSGGILGQGIKKGGQTQLGFLSEPQTDFIFAAIAEETGLLGVSLLLFLFALLLWRIMRIAFFAQKNFPRLFSLGFVILLVSQIFINVGMNLGILPVIGIPLPFVSYGGSNLIANFIVLGLIQNLIINP